MNTSESTPEKESHTTVIIPILAGLALAVLLRLFVIDIKVVSGPSMNPTIADGERIITWRLSYGIIKPEKDDFFVMWNTPQVGDIVTYYVNGRPVVKRCVATEGMAIAFSTDSRYSLTVGNTTIPLTEQQYQRIKFDTVVPSGTFLAIGDNYEESVDSRDYGFVYNHCVTGKVLFK